MSRETKKWWECNSSEYQRECNIPVDIHYGCGSPNEKVLRLLGNVKGKNVLEIGCGGAQCSVAFAKQGAKVTGIDISTEQLKFARALAEKNKVNIKFYQRDIRKFPQIKSNSQDIVFTAWALHYVDDLGSCFREAHRVLKRNGLFVMAMPHPFHELTDPKTLKVKRSYFETGKEMGSPGKKARFVEYTRTVSEIYNYLVDAGFMVEKMIEPDSRKRHAGDPWYGLWDLYTAKFMKMIPPTIIFKCRKLK